MRTHLSNMIWKCLILSLAAGLFVRPPVLVYADGVLKEQHMYDQTLVSTTLPEGTKYIGTRAFYSCPQLESVTIPDGCRRIGESAFAMCPKLAYVSIPSTVETIEPGAFAGCTALTNLSFRGTNPHFFYSDGVLYDPDTTKLISYLPGKDSTFYNMPNTVNQIDKYAFWGAKNLEKVVVSDHARTISPYDFAYCDGLKWVYLPESVKSIQEYAFRDCSSLESIYAGYKKLKVDPTAFFNGKNYSIVSGANLDEFRLKFYTEEDLAAEKKAGEEAERVERERSGLSSNTVSVNRGSSGTWDPDTTSYVTRNPKVKEGIDSLSKWLSNNYLGNGALSYPYVRVWDYPGGYATITPGKSAQGLISLPQSGTGNPSPTLPSNGGLITLPR